MARLLALILIVLIPAATWAEDRPRAGLLWNRSGLPATFPLIVKTLPGRDYLMLVTPPEGGDAVMAGYIRGGDFFRLLLPPGQWKLRFAHGTDWQGQDRLFGDDTEWAEMAETLDFRVLGLNRRRAYVVNLVQQAGRIVVADAQPRQECQLVWWSSEDRVWPDDLRGMPDARILQLYGENLLNIDPPRLKFADAQMEKRVRLCG